MDRLHPGLHIPVQLARCEKDPSAPLGKRRTHIGTVYFPEGTTANEVCVAVSRRQASDSGIWLLQSRAAAATPSSDQRTNVADDDVDGASYVPIKDSKHALIESNAYLALYYNGPDIFLMMPT